MVPVPKEAPSAPPPKEGTDPPIAGQPPRESPEAAPEAGAVESARYGKIRYNKEIKKWCECER